MVEELDVWRAAQLLVDNHGSYAEIQAAARADELMEAGDMVGRSVWLRVVAAIRELQRAARGDEPLN